MPGSTTTDDPEPSLCNIYPDTPPVSTNASNFVANLHRSNAVRGGLTTRLQRSQTIDVSIPTLDPSDSSILGENVMDDPAGIFTMLTDPVVWAYPRQFSPSHEYAPRTWDDMGLDLDAEIDHLNSRAQLPSPRIPVRRHTVSVADQTSGTDSSVGDDEGPLTSSLLQRRGIRLAPIKVIHADDVDSFPLPRVRSSTDSADRSPSKRHGVVYDHYSDFGDNDETEPSGQNFNEPCISPFQYEDPNRNGPPIICPVPKRISWPFFASPGDIDAMLHVSQPEIEEDVDEYARFGDTVIRSSAGDLPQVVEPDEVPSFLSAQLFPERSLDGEGEGGGDGKDA